MRLKADPHEDDVQLGEAAASRTSPGRGPQPASARSDVAHDRAGPGAERRSARRLRAFDLAVCLLLLPVAVPVGLVTALLIFLDSPGPVTFRSTRVGKGGREFAMLKFRKMRRSVHAHPLTTLDDDRFTPIGRCLALTKLDELPQLWNVLRGDMRIVGPRPEVPEFVARYRSLYDEILTVLPGVTGPAALAYASESHLLALQSDPSRFYVEELMPRKIDIDTDYVRNRSFWGDIRIVALTTLVPAIKIVDATLRGRRIRRLESILLVATVTILAVVFALAGTPS
jgi:lipopolysaccharide/colanic/teichoic acid biosynthesis glycosyltransferase